MVKRIFSLMLLLTAVTLGMKAQTEQAPQLTPLPLNPKVLHGTLPNGLNYYILHNEEPKGRANFYIAQKVGSTLETKEQLGLAHFLEHMAFNGTKNFPGKNMLTYLQNNGVRFGSDINAYTSFDETVYNINNVPTSNNNLMDSVLLMLHDWSCDLLLEDAEIDAERGVIEEEWRQGNDANTRMYTALLPQLYDEYQYTQMPIGLMSVVKNFPYQDLRNYYHKWYRPDQQGIVIVGDFDAAEMEKKVVQLFSTIPMPENAAERVYPKVSDNKELRYATFSDPELQMGSVMFALKFDKTPFEMRNTYEVYMQDNVMLNMIASMINNRLSELSKKADCPFAYAGVHFGDYWVSKTKGAFNVTVIPKTDVTAAFKAAMSEVVRSLKTGFTSGELSRVRNEFISNYEKMYNERDKTNSDALGREIIRHFVDNEPAPGIEKEKELVDMYLPMMPVAAFNQLAASVITPENQVVVVAIPENSGMQIPSKEVMDGTLKEVINAEYTAYEDKKLDVPLIPEMPAKGSIVSQSNNTDLGIEMLELSNGAKVIVKSTDFKSDEILISAVARGGKSCLGGTSASNMNMMDVAVESSKLGAYDNTELEKYLAGKNVSMNFSLGTNSTSVQGNSTVKDLPTAMELMYAMFTELEPDKDMYGSTVQQLQTMLANQMKNPQVIFFQEVYSKWYDNNPMTRQLTLEDVSAANYDEMLGTAKSLLSNARDFTFIFTGNATVDELKPLIEQYIASLPSESAKSEYTYEIPGQHMGSTINYTFEKEMASPQTMVFDVFTGKDTEYNINNDIQMEFISDILDLIYTRTLREDEGGTYGAACQSVLNPYNNEWAILYFFGTGADKVASLEARAYKEFTELLTKGALAEDFNKVKLAAQAQYEINVKKNSYWRNILTTYALTGHDEYTGYDAILNSITLEKQNSFMKNLYNKANLKNKKKGNRVQVIMNGVAAAK